MNLVALLNLMWPNCGQVAICERLYERIRGVVVALLMSVKMAPEQQKRPRPESRALSEPPIGIEPMTYSLRVNRSGRLS